MTGLIRKATLLSACALLVAGAAMANVPYPGNCTSPAFIRVVGNTASVRDTVNGVFIVVVKDLSGAAINGSNVVVDFSGCADIKLASNQLDGTVITVNCTSKYVSAYTDVTGTIRFTSLGNSFGGPVSGASCARIYADGVLLSSPTVAAPDLDGAGGVGPNDVSVLLGDIGTHIYYGRSDIDANGTLGPNDLSIELGIIGTHASNSTGITC